MPPNSPGITSSVLDGPTGEMRIVVTDPTFGDERAWGEQFLVVLRAGRGMALSRAQSGMPYRTGLRRATCSGAELTANLTPIAAAA